MSLWTILFVQLPQKAEVLNSLIQLFGHLLTPISNLVPPFIRCGVCDFVSKVHSFVFLFPFYVLKWHHYLFLPRTYIKMKANTEKITPFSVGPELEIMILVQLFASPTFRRSVECGGLIYVHVSSFPSYIFPRYACSFSDPFLNNAASIPDSVKAELLQKIRTFLLPVAHWYINAYITEQRGSMWKPFPAKLSGKD